MIRIVIADDHAMVRAGLSQLLGSFEDLEVVGTASDGREALDVVGELRPDYIFFGKLDGDIKPEAHPKNLALGEWWASMIEIPCIVMGGTDLSSALAVAEAGAEFVALRSAVFSHPEGSAAAVAAVNALLDEKAPRFEA